jgi:hypothetical protein
MERIKNKEFKAWIYDDIEEVFGLKRLYEHHLWGKLAKLEIDKNYKYIEQIEEYRQQLFMYVDTWNEDELKFMFISRLIGLVSFFSPNYKVFTQRPLSVKYNNGTQTTSGKIEFMLAKGKQIPKKPFFFLHEYKQENRRDNDPLGQLLIAMIAAQVQNADNETLYGCFVSGRNWFFVLLEGKEYSVSKAYDASDNDIYQIFAILLWFKEKAEQKFA